MFENGFGLEECSMTTETINVKGTNVNQALDEHHARLKAEAGEPTLEIQTSEPKKEMPNYSNIW